MALSRVGGSSAAANSIAIPTHQAGDLIVIFAYRDGNTTPPTIPAAGGTVPTFTAIDNPTGANNCSAVCAWAVAAGATDTSGTWTNATGMSVEVWRGQGNPAIGGHAQSGASVASGGNISLPAVTLVDSSGNSALLGFAGWQNVTAWNAAPAGYTQQSQVATECECVTKDVTTTSPAVNVSGTASATGGTRTQRVEIIFGGGNRLSQEVAEVVYSTTSAKARLSQIVIEVLRDVYVRPGFIASVTTLYTPTVRLVDVRPPFIASVTSVYAPTLQGYVDVPFISSGTTVYAPALQDPNLLVPFIASVTAVYAPTLAFVEVDVPFISSSTVVYTPTLTSPAINAPFIASVTVVYAPTLAGQISVPFISSKTHVWAIMSLFDPNKLYAGQGNGGEGFLVRLNANGITDTATLATSIGTGTGAILSLTGDSAFPTTHPFIVTIDDEQLYVSQISPGHYFVRARARGNTTVASHTAGATVSWGDSYDLALIATEDINHDFTADINSTGSFTYPGWLICFDSSQAYLDDGSRYPFHVTEVMGVFDAGAGVSGSNRCDSSQPNAISTPTGASDDCPAALSNPARIATDIVTGDTAVLRYTNPESVVLDLGPRSASLQSWFGLKRVDSTDNDVTFTDTDGYVVDTIPSGPGPGPFSGSVNGEWDPAPLLTGIAPAASDADPANAPIYTPNPVPWTTVTLPGSDRYFTYGAPHYNEQGWPMCCLTVRQGRKRVPFWQSWDWHDFSYVYSGFAVDATYAQILINRNGVLFQSVPAVELPGPQDIDGPDAVWDDADYAFGASWYVVIFATPYIVGGPTIGGTHNVPPGGPVIPQVNWPGGGGNPPSFGGSSGPPPPPIEGGSGGNIGGSEGLHVWQTS